MITHILSWINCTLFGFTLLLFLGGGYLWLSQPTEISCVSNRENQCGLPKGAFELPEQAYQQMGEQVLSLKQAPPVMQLPDLKPQLIYYGKNGRPDVRTESTLLHFALTSNNKEVVSIAPETPLYLVYDKKTGTGRYNFSPGNEKTSLWIEGKQIDNEVQVNVGMENEKGERLGEPEAFAQFRLPEKEFSRHSGSTWDVGAHRVDGTLLSRQKARWYGMDRFLEQHGGSDYKDIIGKQRIDFGEGEEIYFVFASLGDCLIWKDNRWQVVAPGGESLGYPLLVLKKIDERLMTFELWDTEGKGKTNLNLLKSSEPWSLQNNQMFQNVFKFLGARTLTQSVFEINHERVILSPSDWLLQTSKGWKKLTTEAEIDQYVQRKLVGTLFVFDRISRKEDRQMMIGTIYSPSRHESQPVEFFLQVGGGKSSSSREDKEKEEGRDKGAGRTKENEKESDERIDAKMRAAHRLKEVK